METFSFLVAVDNTMLLADTDALLAAVLAATLVTLNVTPTGTDTCACSLTVAVSVVVWLLSGSTTAVCAIATLLLPMTSITALDANESLPNVFILISSSVLRYGVDATGSD